MVINKEEVRNLVDYRFSKPEFLIKCFGKLPTDHPIIRSSEYVPTESSKTLKRNGRSITIPLQRGEIGLFIVRNSIERKLPDFADLGKAEGFVHACDQAALMFGSNRKIPVALRPVVTVRKDGVRAVVLPCTTKDHAADPEFFELVNDIDVQWTKPWDGRRSFACSRYEVLAPSHLRHKVGIMPQSARIRILGWIMERW